MLYENLTSNESVSEYSKHTTSVNWIEMGYRNVLNSQLSALSNPGLFIDFGCGPGFFSAHLAKHYQQHVIGVDISSEMVNECRKNHSSDNVIFSVINNSKLLGISDNSIDGVVSCYVFMQIRSHQEQIDIAKEIFRVIKPNGKLTILTMNPRYTGTQFDFIRNGCPERKYKPGEKMTTVMTTEHGVLELEDIYWPQEYYSAALTSAGFNNVTTIECFPEFGINQEKAQFLIIEGVKLNE